MATTKVLEIAKSQIGVREATGHNDGPAVEKYLASVGLGKGYAWCQSFAYWVCKEAYGKENNPLVKTGGVLRNWSETKLKKSKTPIVGSIFVMDLGKGLGHTGFVTGIEGDSILTIEGNTNDGGSREGIGVFARKRKINTIKGYILLP